MRAVYNETTVKTCQSSKYCEIWVFKFRLIKNPYNVLKATMSILAPYPSKTTRDTQILGAPGALDYAFS